VEAGAGSTARDLHLLGEVKTLSIDGQDREVIDGSTTLTVELDTDDTLDDLVSKVEALQGGVRAAVLNDGSLVNPYRLTLTSQATGLAGALLVDTSQVGFTLDETVAAQDALLLAGTAGASGLLASSSTNTFREVLDGVSLSLKAASGDPVTVAVETTDESLVSTVQGLVDAYNRLRDKLDELTEFDEESGQSAVLQGDGAALRVESDAANLFTSRLFFVGPFQSLQALGVRVQDDGRLELDAAQLQARFAENPSAVADFLSKDELGLADRVDKLAEQLAGVGGSLLVNRVESLDRKLSTNSDRVEFLNARLEAARQRLLARFQRSETIIARIQANLSAIASLAPLTPLSLNNGN
jgi:flagellar hook-associated protein 2